jgi:hypothetical protein
MFRKKWFVVLVLLGVFLTAEACAAKEIIEPKSPQTISTPTSTSDTGDGEEIEGVARISEIDILILESFPVQVNVVARGNLPDGCTEINGIDRKRIGNTFEVTITTTRPANQMCTEALVPFEQVISLDVAGIEAGKYTVNVNGVTDTFELAMDNKLPEEPVMEDQDTSGAMVESVETMLSKDDPATMALLVSGNLRDGCTEIVDVTTAVRGSEIVVEILTERPADRMCTQALVPFEERVTIDVSGLTGTHRLMVNDYSTTVDLSVLTDE